MATVAALIEKNRDLLVTRFLEEASRLEPAGGLRSYEVIDTLPEYLDTLCACCQGDPSEEVLQTKQRLEATHIGHRLRVGYNLEQTTDEYLLMGRLISDLWEPLPVEQRPAPAEAQRLFRHIQGAMEHAVSVFNGGTVEDRRNEKRTLRHLEQLAGRLFDEPLALSSPGERLAPLLEVVREAMGADAAALMMRDATGERLLPAAATGAWAGLPWSEPVALDSDTFVAQVAASDEPVHVPDATRGVRLDGDLPHQGVHSLLGLRLGPAGAPLGVLVVGQVRTRAFEPRARRHFEVLVESLAALLEKGLLRQELRRAQARLRESEAHPVHAESEAMRLLEDRQRLLLEATGVGTWDYAPDTDALRWDARCRELFGVAPDAPLNLDAFFSHLHPEDRERTRAGVREALRPGGSGTYSQEFRVLGPPGGAPRWLASTGQAFFDASGRAVRFLGIVVDITARVHEREAIQRERHRVIDVLESISDAFLAFDARWCFTYVNREAERLLGLPRERLLGRDHWEVFPATLGTPVEHFYRRAARERVPLSFENHYAPWDRWFELRVYPTDEGVAVYFHDVTEKKRSEAEREALLREQVRLREQAERALRERQLAVEVLEHGDAVFVVDKDYRFVLVNDNEERIARMPRERMLGRTIWEAFPPAARPESKYWTQYRRVVEQRVPAFFEEYYAPLDLWTSVSAYPTSSGGMAAFIRDVTEQKRAEQFQERLLGIVSHDLRNPLQNILLTTELLLRREGVQEAVLAGVRRIAGSADRMQRMISDLLDFTRASVGGGIPLERQPVGLWAVVETTLQEFELTHPGRVAYSSARGMREGLFDPGRLGQVVSNLVANALTYGDERTPVEVRLWDEGPESVLAVHNAGEPIPEELLPRIFDPFKQATRGRTRRGLGLGLYIVQQLVLAHGGTITVHSTREEGTTFTVRLPHGAER